MVVILRCKEHDTSLIASATFNVELTFSLGFEGCFVSCVDTVEPNLNLLANCQHAV